MTFENALSPEAKKQMLHPMCEVCRQPIGKARSPSPKGIPIVPAVWLFACLAPLKRSVQRRSVLVVL
jgi:hypothetical protein